MHVETVRLLFIFITVLIQFHLKLQNTNVQSIIDSQDMEQLAAMVLNGDGQFLVGTKSDQPEIQAFLDNVPAYMVNLFNCV